MKIAVLVDLAPCSLVITNILEDTANSNFRVQKYRTLDVKMEGCNKTVICTVSQHTASHYSRA
jgi:hypothetical protein